MSNQKNNQETFETIYTYTSEQATDDGILFAVATVNKQWSERGLFSHITTNLMRKGYIDEEANGTVIVNMNNLVDLLNQAVQIVKKAAKPDWFFSGQIELPSGEQQLIYITQNETGHFTIMLPEDY